VSECACSALAADERNFEAALLVLASPPASPHTRLVFVRKRDRRKESQKEREKEKEQEGRSDI